MNRAERERALICKHLAKDAFRTAARQYKYSKEAMSEKKFSDRDMVYTKRVGYPASYYDDKHESLICREFSMHRRELSRIYKKLGDRYSREAEVHMRLSKQKR